MFRKLENIEIDKLKSNNCWADDWNNITVKDNFNPNSYNLVRFSGIIKLGETTKYVSLDGGISVGTGIFNAKIHNSTIGDNTYISNVNQYIASYDIGDNVIINNIDRMYIKSTSCFGNGIKVSVLNETGGRDVMIYDSLSSHLAYIMAIYRHEHKMVERVESMITAYAESIKSDRGVIGNNSNISNCRTIIDVRIGENSIINGASHLENGSINSTSESNVEIGNYVIAKNFIICNSTKIMDGAIIENCFVGQGCNMGKQYSAENSLFFSNCVGMHGEACSIFAGPFTVTHHKSTLLIAGMFSFMNAGSGSNQSNHMYKLGPIHQGVIERGSKTTSDSYILWPAKIGAFSVVMGRHYNNCDSSIFPFSYLIESSDESYLVPGVNLKSVGTIRDTKKWPTRDGRKGNKIDQLNFNLLSPYTINKMIKGTERLQSLLETYGSTSATYSYENCIIKNSALTKGIKYYDIAITKFFGNSIIKRLESIKNGNMNEIHKALKPSTDIGVGLWVDISGLLAPKSEITNLICKIKNKEINTLEQIHSFFITLNENYYEYEWSWVYNKMHAFVTKYNDHVTAEDIIKFIKKWIDSVVSLDEMLYVDAKKEFTLTSKTSFGADGGKSIKANDFHNVRGDFENNNFVLDVLDHIKKKTALGNELIERISKLE